MASNYSIDSKSQSVISTERSADMSCHLSPSHCHTQGEVEGVACAFILPLHYVGGDPIVYKNRAVV
jgi:hypothetical protein